MRRPVRILAAAVALVMVTLSEQAWVEDGAVDVAIVLFDGVLTSNVFVAEVAHDLQFQRVANATVPPRLDWRLALIIAGAASMLALAIAAIGLRLLAGKRAKAGVDR